MVTRVGTGRQYSHGPPAGQIGPKYRGRRRSYPVLASLAVGIFRRLEDFLERMVEAPAGRLGAAPQPVTLAKRIARAMDTNKRFGEDGVIVPNRYVLHLSPTDYASFEAYQGSLEEDLAHDVLTRARREGYRLMARPRVILQPDGLVPRGEVRVAAAVADADESAAEPVQALPDATSVLARAGHAVPEPNAAARAFLVVQTDGGPAARFDLGAALIAIGRAADNDVILDDPQVSRHHCQLKLQHGAYGLVDLGSRNGSSVNGQRVEEIALADGDRIRIGNTSVEFRLRG
jgi:FHA domain-containing protein